MSSQSHAASLFVNEIFDRVASDLAMLSDRDFEILGVEYEERTDRPAGPGLIHVSFRFGIVGAGGDVEHGAMILPLPESISLAAYLMMQPDTAVADLRLLTKIDHAIKEAMLEVGNFVAAAGEAALRAIGSPAISVIFEGCQGVRADVRPALPYEEGTTLSVGRAKVQIAGAAPVEMVVMVPKSDVLVPI
ncbi:hypothetical protein Poly30_29760 [Planctomycetes bacterium Poly30]|uniref:Chemotaxis phosphatase CheX-like domain-containing protein n=1 Tax=Saltatorellus ferox TaxID=2528018 RepID=A0A518ETN1_9BACT|nr:hypothetical protein Poly30_29760 [Planctomycetes bacterium Poly30]